MKRKIIISLLGLFCCASLIGGYACDKGGGTSTTDSSDTGSSDVIIPEAITEIDFFADEIYIPVGRTRTIDVKTTPFGLEEQLTWVSSLSSRVGVNNGIINAVRKTSSPVVITATDSVGQLSAEISVVVVEEGTILDVAYDAIEELENVYSTYDFSLYSAKGQDTLLRLKGEGACALEALQTEAQISQKLQDLKENLAAVKTQQQEIDDGVFVNYLGSTAPVTFKDDGSIFVNGKNSGWLRSGLNYATNSGMDEFVWTTEISFQDFGVYSALSGVRLRFAFLDSDEICKYGFAPTFDGDRDAVTFERVYPFFFGKIGPGGEWTFDSTKTYVVVITRSLIGDEAGNPIKQKLIFEAYEKIDETNKVLVCTKYFEDNYVEKLIPSYGVENVSFTIHSVKVKEVTQEQVSDSVQEWTQKIEQEKASYDAVKEHYTSAQLAEINQISSEAITALSTSKYLGDIINKSSLAIDNMASIIPESIPQGFIGNTNAVVDENTRTITFSRSTENNTAKSRSKHAQEYTWESQITGLSGNGTLTFAGRDSSGATVSEIKIQLNGPIAELYFGGNLLKTFSVNKEDKYLLTTSKIFIEKFSNLQKDSLIQNIQLKKVGANDAIYSGSVAFESANTLCTLEYTALNIDAVVTYPQEIKQNDTAKEILANAKIGLVNVLKGYVDNAGVDVYGANRTSVDALVSAMENKMQAQSNINDCISLYQQAEIDIIKTAELAPWKNNGSQNAAIDGENLMMTGSFNESIISQKLDYVSFVVTVDIPKVKLLETDDSSVPKRVRLSLGSYNINLHYQGESKASGFYVGAQSVTQLTAPNITISENKEYRIELTRVLYYDDYGSLAEGLRFALYEKDGDAFIPLYKYTDRTPWRASDLTGLTSVSYQQHNVANKAGAPTVFQIRRISDGIFAYQPLMSTQDFLNK